MTFVITDKCVGERYASCMQVCPVYCIYPGELDGRPFAPPLIRRGRGMCSEKKRKSEKAKNRK